MSDIIYSEIDFHCFDEKTLEQMKKTMENIRFSILKSVNIGSSKSEMIEASALPEEPEIYANNKADRQDLIGCYHEFR